MELRRYQRTLLASLLIPYATGFGVGGLEPAISSVNDAVAPFLQYHSQMLLSSSASAELIRPADILAAYKESLASNPLYTKMATGATLAIAGDSIAQSREDEPYDIRRAASSQHLTRLIGHFSMLFSLQLSVSVMENSYSRQYLPSPFSQSLSLGPINSILEQ